MCIRDSSKFEQENERRPSPEELADELEIPVDKISDTLKVSGRHISVCLLYTSNRHQQEHGEIIRNLAIHGTCFLYFPDTVECDFNIL